MKQILQNLGNGETILADVPCPARSNGQVLIRATNSLVSLGTERMLIEFGKGNLIAKARSQPDKVKQVLQKIKTDGLWATVDSVKAKLDAPVPLGYCHVGTVVEADTSSGYAVGDRVISNGNHAEMVSVPCNLTAGIPDAVSDEAAAFTVVGAIGLQGIRLLQPTLGERIVVSGLGLIGLMVVQMLRAHGCQVLGLDFDQQKLALARQFGAETVDLSTGQDPVAFASEWTNGHGVDGVIITASTKSDEVVHQAATMCRKRGRIVLVGVVGLNFRRSDFYEKELSFQVSCSYGPGRYESNYEDNGMDYPIGFVRWTEQRNFEAVLQLMAEGKLNVEPLISHRFAFDQALEGYETVGNSGALGVLFDYSNPADDVEELRVRNISSEAPVASSDGKVTVAFIGAGAFTTRMLLPLLPAGIRKKSIVSSTGVSATYAAKKFGFENISSDYKSVLDDPEINTVFVTTRHNSHSKIVAEALRAGKHVFVEKPLAISSEGLELVKQAAGEHPECCLMVGFNRRFSPHSTAIRNWLKAAPPAKAIVITVNAGAIPGDHWTQDLEIGGGRIAGEACHFIDLARYLADAPISHADAMPMCGAAGRFGDCVSIQLGFSNGSIATIHYLANGSKDFPKERIEVFAGERVYVCDNFRRSHIAGGKHRLKTSQDKGHREELSRFIKAIQNGGDRPISFGEILEVSEVSLQMEKQVRERLAEFPNHSS